MRSGHSLVAPLRRLVHRFLTLFRGRRMEADMAEEMRLHMEMQEAEHRGAGMTPGEAALKARREFGHLDGIREQCRDERGFLWVSQLGQDLRYAFRMLARHPGFTAVAVLTLALGIGVNTAIFGLVDEILLRQLPVRDPGGLVLLRWSSKIDIPVPTSGSWEQDPVTHQNSCTSFSIPAFEGMKGSDGALSGVAAFAPISRLTVIADGQPEAVGLGQLVSGGFFSLLGVAPAAGRLIGDSDDTPAAAPVAMISHGYWMRRFGADPSVLGKTVLVNHIPVTIVGVCPRRFPGTLEVGDAPDLFLPLSLAKGLGSFAMIDDPNSLWWLRILGRLRPGASPAAVRATLEPAFQLSVLDSFRRVGAAPPRAPGDLPTLIAGPGGQGLSRIRNEYRQRWAILAGLGGTILAIACANIASLLLARGAARQREFGVRLAMGAGRGRIIRQLLAESVLLSALGGVLAVPFAVWMERCLVAMQPRFEGHTLALSPRLDSGVFLIAAAFSLITGVVFGLAPALRASRLEISAEFQGGQGNLSGSRSRLGKALLAVQVALTLVLLVGAGLFAGTLRNLASVDVGFERDGLLLFHLDPSLDGSSFEAGLGTDNQVVERLRALPGVTSATFSRMPLLSEMGWNSRISVPGRPPGQGGGGTAMVNAVDRAFFETYGIPLVEGRPVGPSETSRIARVAVVNQAFAREFFGDENPLGRTIERPDERNTTMAYTVIGVARDARYSSVRDPVPPTVYFPYHFLRGSMPAEATFAVRAPGDVAALIPRIRDVVRSVNPLLPIDELRTQRSQIGDLSSTERMFAWLSVVFALLATGLVTLGLYGLMSFVVLRRRKEIGLRIALGARPPDVVWMIVRESLVIVGSGVGLGLVGALAATKVVSSLLFGLTATDPATFLLGCALLMSVALIAGWVPARRASRVDPMVALRTE